MAITLKCRCSNAFSVPNSFAGNSAMCPECGKFIDIPEEGEVPEFVDEQEAEEEEIEQERERRSLKRQVREAVESDIEPVKRTSGYRFAVGCVAVAMIALPGMYVGLILLIAALLVWHTLTNYDFFWTMRIFAALFYYVGPIMVGLMLLVFMVKPLFARPARARRGKLIRLEKEPLLADFVDNIAWAVHAPRPKRIEVDCQVNASAGFGSGLTGLFGNDLTLTIGLPLVVGLTARQFAGVVCRRHFAQGGAMRVSYIVRTINAWFARVVYERDSWDESLHEWSQESGIAGVLASAIRGCVLATRGILWVFMAAGNVLSCYLMRHMEFDADRSFVRLVGVRTYEKTMRRITILDAATVEAAEILENCCFKERYPDDCATLLVALADDMPTREYRKTLDKMEEGGCLFTAPIVSDRLASVEREDHRRLRAGSAGNGSLQRDCLKIRGDCVPGALSRNVQGGIRATLEPVKDTGGRKA